MPEREEKTLCLWYIAIYWINKTSFPLLLRSFRPIVVYGSRTVNDLVSYVSRMRSDGLFLLLFFDCCCSSYVVDSTVEWLRNDSTVYFGMKIHIKKGKKIDFCMEIHIKNGKKIDLCMEIRRKLLNFNCV